MSETLSERQQREVEYHKEYADGLRSVLEKPTCYDVLRKERRRWWNAYWDMYTFLMAQDLAGKKVLIVGCGFGEDALRLARLGAEVHGFDLSPDMLALARKLAERERVQVDLREMPAEKLDYDDETFDVVLARDILHHVEIDPSMREIARVSRPGGLFVMNENYSHSLTDLIRRSALVEKFLYGALRDFVYKGEKPYITEDERKLNERDISVVLPYLREIRLHKYFDFLVNRVLPDRWACVNRIDRSVLAALGPVASRVAGRVLMAGVIDRSAARGVPESDPIGRS